MTSPGQGVPGLPGSGAEDTKGIAGELGSWLKNPAGGILGTAFRILSNLFGKGDTGIAGVQEWIDGQELLNERTDLLSPLLDYGSAYMDTSGGFTNTGQAWFVNQVGPMQKCHINQGRIILEEAGLWDIRASLWFGPTGFGGGVGWNVRVLKPDGSIYSEKMEYFNDQSECSALSISSVVVPAAGYQVQVYVTVIAATRGIIGGVQRNRLTVQHISRDTTSGNTGQE